MLGFYSFSLCRGKGASMLQGVESAELGSGSSSRWTAGMRGDCLAKPAGRLSGALPTNPALASRSRIQEGKGWSGSGQAEPSAGNKRAPDTMGSPLPAAVCSWACAKGSLLLTVELDRYIWRVQPLGEGPASPPPQSICCPLLSPSLVLSALLWALRVCFLPALVPELRIHNVSVKTT